MIIQTQTAGQETSKQELWPDKAPIGDGKTEDANAYITIYRPAIANGASAVICPGGGYGGLVRGAEGTGIAEWLAQNGILGIVLEYRLPDGDPYRSLHDVQRAIRTVRANAAAWECDPNRIGVIGFSAGGHLASTASTHFNNGDPDSKDSIERMSSRPDFSILIYPVITMGTDTHAGSRYNLLGEEPTPALMELFSSEKQVSSETPPAFLAHAVNDHLVPSNNSERYYNALRAHNINAEYLELPSGDHGLNGYQGPMWEAWKSQSLQWLASQKIISHTTPELVEQSKD